MDTLPDIAYPLELLTKGVLVLFSIACFSLLLAASERRWGKRLAEPAQAAVARALANLKSCMRSVHVLPRVVWAGVRANLLAMLNFHREVSPEAAVFCQVLLAENRDGADRAIANALDELDGGGSDFASFLSAAAPLAALAATLVGVIKALGDFGRGSADPGLLTAGFADAMWTTFFGIGIGLGAMLIGRLLIGGMLRTRARRLDLLADEIADLVQNIKNRFPPEAFDLGRETK